MAQSPTVMAFRKRAKSHGYTDIEITRMKGYADTYAIRATEPLAKTYVRTEMTSAEMHQAFKR